MASTNKTTHYELSQYISSDKPTYLVDYNADMSKIDEGINDAQTTADTASTAATNAQTAAESAATTANTAITNAATADGKAVQAQTNIGVLANLTTVNKDSVVSAINELDNDIDNVNISINSINTSITSINGELNNLKETVLWTNPNPTASFGSQNVSVNLNDYKYVEIYYTRYEGVTEFCDKVNYNNAEVFSQLFYCDYDNGSVRAWDRNVRLDSNGVYFNTATINGSVDNKALIPFKICGYKD